MLFEGQIAGLRGQIAGLWGQIAGLRGQIAGHYRVSYPQADFGQGVDHGDRVALDVPHE
jgi:hypothetical protein